MGRIVFRLGLAALALYFYVQGDTFSAVLCVVAIVWSFIQLQMALLLSVMQRLTNIPQEHDANSVLAYTFRLDRVFGHPAVDDVFEKLHKNQKAPAQTLDGWRKLLAESYARKYKRDDLVCEVRFNIKANILFVNGEPDFRDYVYHEVEIPYRWTSGGDPEEFEFRTPEIEAHLSVRVLLINGMLQLQVGPFSEEYSPHVLRRGYLGAYQRYAPITSFPLMYFSYQHGIPVRYFNLIAKATPSYKARYVEQKAHMKEKSDEYKDWRTLHKDAAAYRVLCDSDSESYSYDRYETFDKLKKAFKEKREKLLAAEGYMTIGADNDDDQYPDLGATYWNDYATVFFRNMNANRGSSHEARWLADYNEKEP